MKNDVTGVNLPKILFPKEGADYNKWAVVACDQYTSEMEYWKDVENYVGDAPSTLHLIYPEAYLEDENDDREARIAKIRENMKKYLAENTLVEDTPGFIYLDRSTEVVSSRKGLMVLLDLEKYDYNKGSQTLIRATEGTVLDRLPPRIKVRKGADLELPHILILIDDPERNVIEPLAEKVDQMKKIYDFDLMKNSGHITGYKIEDENLSNEIQEGFAKLADKETFKTKYGVGDDKGVLLFAVGDGNHSLATAKAIWEQLKEEGADADNPARFALVEIENVHDEGIEFEPIHRVVFDVDYKDMLAKMDEYYKGIGCEFSYEMAENKDHAFHKVNTPCCCSGACNAHSIVFVAGTEYGVMTVKNPKSNLAVGTLQAFIDEYLKTNTKSKVDYIHGDDVVVKLSQDADRMGFFLPAMEKSDLFKTVILDGALPRKTFSMGEASEKRFYIECRKIQQSLQKYDFINKGGLTIALFLFRKKVISLDNSANVAFEAF